MTCRLTISGKELQTADDVAETCAGRFIDTNRKEWSSDAGIPTTCNNAR